MTTGNEMGVKAGEANRLLTIMIVDDHPAILRDLKVLIEGAGIARVVVCETDGYAALSSALVYRPDLVILNVSFPELTCFEIAESSIERWPEVRILAVSNHLDALYLPAMLVSGAQGCMLKEHALEELENAIQTIMNGGKWIGKGLFETELKK